jgi:glycosyltransferase involved in cell wall biosynthesis
VHVHGDGGFLAYRGPYVRTFYGTAGLELRHSRTLKGRAAQGLSWWMERREARRCAVCAGISPHIAGYLPGNIRTVPCMLPADPDPAPARKTAHPSMIFIGSRFSRKRGELALELHRRLRASRPDLRLTYVGPPGEVAGLAGSPGTEGVDFRSRLGQDELLDLYRASWIYLCLSSYEGFGVGIIEAMACSCAVFTTPHPGSDYLVEDGVTGVVAPPEAAEAALARLLSDHAGRAALAGRAREHARRFAPAAVAGAYLGLYREAGAPEDSGGRPAGGAGRLGEAG